MEEMALRRTAVKEAYRMIRVLVCLPVNDMTTLDKLDSLSTVL